MHTQVFYQNLSLCLSILTAIFPGGPGLGSTRMSPF